MNKNLIIAMLVLLTIGVGTLHAAVPAIPVTAGHRTESLPNEAWLCSQWIAVPGAPEKSSVTSDQDQRAADGASWFCRDISNDKKVKKIVWMTAGLGIYQLYANGKPIGKEVLRPGYTHLVKTRRSFTYDITDAMNLKPGAINRLSVQSTPGWWADRSPCRWRIQA